MLKRKTSSGFTALSTFKRWTGSVWKTLTTAKRYNGTSWINLLETPAPTPTGTIVKTYNIKSAQNYWNSGGKDTQFPSELIQGTWNSELGSARRCLLWFDGDFAADLQGATISKVELYLYRKNDGHGVSGGANVKIKMHNYSTLPTKWTGTDAGAADSGTPTLKRGTGAWFTLYNSVGVGLRDGTIKGLCLDADSSTSMSDYLRCTKSKTQLRITYGR